MKKIVHVFTLLFTATLLSAQITVTSSTFPETGDTLKIRTNFIPDGIEIGPTGGDQVWDFTSLGGNLTNETVFLDASAGTVADQLPNATHLTIDPATGAENYYQITNEEINFLGAFGNDPTGFGIEALFRFTPPIVERRAPMSYPSESESEANLLIALAWSDLPPVLTDSLNLPPALTPDSIRVRIVQERSDSTNAWGTLSIPGGEYEVLREKRTQFTETRVDILVEIPFLGWQWQDVTDLLLSGFPQLGTSTTTTYNFFSADEKEIIAVARMDSTGMNVNRVDYKNNGVVSSTADVLNEGAAVWVMPNPVTDVVRFGLQDFPQGNVYLKISSLTGNAVTERKLQVDGSDQTVQLDLSDVPSGNYFFQFSTDQGKVIAAGKLTKI